MGDSQEEYNENLKSVLNSIEQDGMTLYKNKCVIDVEEVEFLGLKVGKYGIKAGPKIQGIVDFPLPKLHLVLLYIGTPSILQFNIDNIII